MADLQAYTSMATYVDGTQLAESTQTTVKINGNHIDNVTEAKGFAGQSLGASTVEITIENVVPTAGFELDVSEDVITNVPHELTVFVGGKTLTVAGYFTDCETSKGVNAEAKLTLNFKGQAKFFE